MMNLGLFVSWGASFSCLDKCRNLQNLNIEFADWFPKVPTFCFLANLSKLVIWCGRLNSPTVFDALVALRTLELNDCRFECDWKSLGTSLAHTSVKNLSFRNIHCSVDNLESLLDSVELDYLHLSKFRSISGRKSGLELYREFEEAFHAKRRNPRTLFLIEEDDHARALME